MATKEELIQLRDNANLPQGVKDLFNTAIEREELRVVLHHNKWLQTL